MLLADTYITLFKKRKIPQILRRGVKV